jgi:hypothetical protein
MQHEECWGNEKRRSQPGRIDMRSELTGPKSGHDENQRTPNAAKLIRMLRPKIVWRSKGSSVSHQSKRAF